MLVGTGATGGEAGDAGTFVAGEAAGGFGRCDRGDAAAAWAGPLAEGALGAETAARLGLTPFSPAFVVAIDVALGIADGAALGKDDGPFAGMTIPTPALLARSA